MKEREREGALARVCMCEFERACVCVCVFVGMRVPCLRVCMLVCARVCEYLCVKERRGVGGGGREFGGRDRQTYRLTAQAHRGMCECAPVSVCVCARARARVCVCVPLCTCVCARARMCVCALPRARNSKPSTLQKHSCAHHLTGLK